MSSLSAVRAALEFCINFVDHPTQFLLKQWEDHPYHIFIEISFILAIVYFYMIPLHKAKKMRVEPLTKKEEEMLLDEFHSEAFRSTKPDSNAQINGEVSQLTVVARSGVKVTVLPNPKASKAVECFDLATFDFHSLSTHEEVRDVAKRTVAAYGCGSCGPRGFYGTIKPHLDLESDIATFLGVDACIVYSYSFATVSTLIPCYASRGDYLLADEGVCLPIQEGCHLSRSNVNYYKHNDVFHLEELMMSVVAKERKAKKLSRRFVVTEGLFRNSGDICLLPDIISLCRKYKFRLILEDSYGFGALGETGRGTPQHYQIATSMIDIYVGSLSTSLGAIGGFCAGEATMIDHQRLAASGYVFSASLPPYVTAAASRSVHLIDASPAQTILPLHRNAKALRNEIRQLRLPATLQMVECVDDISPIIHIRASAEYLNDNGKDAVDAKMAHAVATLQSKKIIVLRHLYTFEERVPNVPSLRIAVKGAASVTDVLAAGRTIVAVLRSEFAR